MPEPLASTRELRDCAARRGFTVEALLACPIQGVLIVLSRPQRQGETFIGLPLAGGPVEIEVVERHYCPGDADEEREAVTIGRACQRAIWAMEGHDA